MRGKWPAAPILRLLVGVVVIVLILAAYVGLGLRFVEVERSRLIDPASLDASATYSAAGRWVPSGGMASAGDPRIAQHSDPGCQPQHTYGWTSNSTTVLSLGLIVCVDDFSAAGVANSLKLGAVHNSTLMPEVGARQRGGPIVQVATDGRALLRIWSRGNVVHILGSNCGDGLAACDASNAAHAQELAATLPDQEDSAFRDSQNAVAAQQTLWTAAILIGVILGALYLPRMVARRRRPKPIPLVPPGARNVGMVASKIAWGRMARGVAVWVALAAGADIAVKYYFYTVTQDPAELPGVLPWIGLAVAAGLHWLGRRLVRRAQFRFTAMVGGSVKAASGAALMTAARGGVVVLILLAILSVVGFYLSLSGAALNVDIAALDRLGVAPMSITPNLVMVFAQVIAREGFWWLMALLAALTALMVGCFALGARLAAASLQEAIDRDARPHVLLLRSFEEDRALVPAEVMAPSILPLGLTPVRQVLLEQVLAQGLASLGPVVAIAPPGVALPQLGAAKVSLQHSEWRDEVARLAGDAIAVVVLATPTSVSREGFGWELELLSGTVGHGRLMVVLGPYSEADRDLRWNRFCEHAGAVPALADLALVQPPGGVRIAVRSKEHDWELFAGADASDAIYLAAINQAVTLMRPRWHEEMSGPRGH
jgi:hypothetical protein